MRVVSRYSFKNGLGILEKEKSRELSEVVEAIDSIKLGKFREPVKSLKSLYSSRETARGILDYLYARGWSRPKIPFGRPDNFIEADASKNGVGLEIQFGEYSFLGWDSLRKMALFGEHGVYKYGIEIAPMASLRRKMSKGVGSFEQVAEKLDKGGNPALGIPIVVLGIDG